jgi:hypothetical protein
LADVGDEASTSVQPLRPRGHSISRRGAGVRGAVLVRAVAVGVVGAVGAVVGPIVSTVVGSCDVSPTRVSLAAL